MSTLKRLFAVLLLLLLPGIAVACLWDYDTLAMERARFPSALELITGKFLRHSPEFYEWRVRDRTAKLEKDSSNLACLDDLAVAYEKLGQHDKAIEIALKQDRIQPNRYETLANLGTFYIHAGQLEKGVGYIDRAIQINPDAHFGRERYQKLLAEYVLSKRVDGKLNLPLAHFIYGSETFPNSIAPATPLTPDEHRAAIQGVLGMMKFGHNDSPVLLEALGQLLGGYGHGGKKFVPPERDAKLLAARAFLKASYEVTDSTTKSEYRELATRALDLQAAGNGSIEQLPLEVLEKTFQQELAEARDWYSDLREKEIGWIRDGKNPETEFDNLYSQEPLLSGFIGPDTALADQQRRARKERMAEIVLFGGASLVLVAVLVAGSFALWWIKHRLSPMK